jgi:hypothetical protein
LSTEPVDQANELAARERTADRFFTAHAAMFETSVRAGQFLIRPLI